MAKTLRIGTRDSALAMWQAKTVQSQLAAHGIASELVPVKSLGDLKLDQPLYELGVTGVFTKTLDLALLAGEIDLAVHSYKDVPTVLAKGLSTAAVLKRASTADVLVHKSPDFTTSGLQIATSSLRRKAQWLAKYPEHQLVDIRGNVQTRLEKLANNSWGGAIFAAAGLARLDLLPENAMRLDWMVPAPAQGAMVVVAQSAHTVLLEELSVLNDFQTALVHPDRTRIFKRTRRRLHRAHRRAVHHHPRPTALYWRTTQFRRQAAYRNQHLCAFGPGPRIRQKNGPKDIKPRRQSPHGGDKKSIIIKEKP